MAQISVICTDGIFNLPRRWFPVAENCYSLRVPFKHEDVIAFATLNNEELQRSAANVAAYFSEQRVVDEISSKLEDVQLNVPILKSEMDNMKLPSTKYFYSARNIDFNIHATPVCYQRETKSLFVASVEDIDHKRRREYHNGQFVPSNLIITKIAADRSCTATVREVVGIWELPIFCYYSPSDLQICEDGFIVQLSRNPEKTFKCVPGQPIQRGKMKRRRYVKPEGVDGFEKTKIGDYFSYRNDKCVIIATAKGKIVLRVLLDGRYHRLGKIVYADENKIVVHAERYYGDPELQVYHYGNLTEEQRNEGVKVIDLFMVDSREISQSFHLHDGYMVRYTHDWKCRAGRMYFSVIDLVSPNVSSVE